MSNPFVLKIGASQILRALIEDLKIGDSRKVDLGGPGIMAVHVERLSAATWSVAHYYEQNGDLCCDPDVVFCKIYTGYMPVSFEQAGVIYQVAAELDAHDQPTALREKTIKDLVVFCNGWMRNICEQQGGIDAIRDARQGGK